MLTVWCVWWRDPANPDKYSEYHVERLRRDVAANLSEPHQFVCITNMWVKPLEANDEGRMYCLRPIVAWPGWWQKLSLFAPGIAADRNLYFDLDVVITGNLDPLAAYADCEFAAAANWSASGHGGIQSSVMAWNGQLTTPFEQFDPRDAEWPPCTYHRPGRMHGDQCWLTRLAEQKKIDWTPIEPSLIRVGTNHKMYFRAFYGRIVAVASSKSKCEGGKKCRFYQGGVGYGIGCQAAFRCIFATLHMDGNELGRTFAIANNCLGQRPSYTHQCGLQRHAISTLQVVNDRVARLVGGDQNKGVVGGCIPIHRDTVERAFGQRKGQITH